MQQQYDFLQVTIEADERGACLSQGTDKVHVTRHQMPDLIRTLQRIHDECERAQAKGNLEQLSRELKGSSTRSIRPMNGLDVKPPKGAA